MKLKRFLVLLLVLCMILPVLPTMTSAVVINSGDWGQDGSDVTWKLDSNGILTISGTGKMLDCSLVSSDMYNEKDWFRGWDEHIEEIKSVVIKEGITYIGEFSFINAVNLKTVTIADSVIEIGRSAFANCDSLTSVSFGTGLTSTGIEVFHDCDALETVSLPNVDVEYGNSFFSKCDKLKSVTIPAKQTTIGVAMFRDCISLTQISIPNTVKSVGGAAFEGCVKLKSITLPDSITEIGSRTFRCCNALTSVVIPDSVISIGNYAFSSCVSLKSITLPAKLQEIDNDVFALSNALTSITVPAMVLRMGHTFRNANGLKTIKFMGHAPLCASELFGSINVTVYYPKNFASWTKEFRKDYGGDVTWVSFVSDADPGEIRATGSCGENVNWTLKFDGTLIISGTGRMTNDNVYSDWYEYKDMVTAVEIQKGVTTIGNYSFYKHKVLKNVSIADTVTAIGSNSFSHCSALKKVQIPDSVHTIYNSAFENCTGLSKEIVIPEGVTSIGAASFSGCSALTKIQFEGLVPPSFEADSFNGVTATAYYPDNSDSWTEDVMQDYGGDITWVSYHVHDYDDAVPVFNAETKTHSWDCAGCDVKKTEKCTFDEVILEEATLEAPGMKKHTCSVCGGSYEAPYIYRVSGADRVGTALAAADLLKQTLGVEKFDSIILADGYNFADALPGSYLAAKKNAPILLHHKRGVDRNEAYIRQNLSADGVVYILGGTVAVPASVETSLTAQGYRVVRLAGNTRYDTNLEILKEAGVTDEEILVCTGGDFADSLSASATGLPILLTNYKTGKLTNKQIAFLSDDCANNFTIIGGTKAVSAEIEEQLRSYGEVVRLSGATRYHSSVLVAERFFADPDKATVASGKDFPDGLCGGPVANALGAPLLLIRGGVEGAAAKYVAAGGITGGAILGGTAVVTDASARIVFGLQ